MMTFARAARALRSAVVLAGITVAMSGMAGGSAWASWWNGDWSYRVKLDADAGPKGANIGDPIGRTQILVRLHQGNFKFDTASRMVRISALWPPMIRRR